MSSRLKALRQSPTIAAFNPDDDLELDFIRQEIKDIEDEIKISDDLQLSKIEKKSLHKDLAERLKTLKKRVKRVQCPRRRRSAIKKIRQLGSANKGTKNILYWIGGGLFGIGLFFTMRKRLQTEGGMNQDISVVRSEKRMSRYGGREHMRAHARGRNFTPTVNQVTVTLEGDPSIRDIHKVRQLLVDEARKNGLHSPTQFIFRHAYHSHRKPDMWEGKWDVS